MNSQKKKDEKKITNIDMVLFAWTNYVHVHWALGKILFIKGNIREGINRHVLVLWIKLGENVPLKRMILPLCWEWSIPLMAFTSLLQRCIRRWLCN